MTDETNFPPKAKVKLPKTAKKKRKAWWKRKKKTDDQDQPRRSGR